MSDANNSNLSDEKKIDRAARHEELRFYTKQQWAVATAGVILLGALLTTAFNVHITALDKLLLLILIALALSADWFVLDKLEEGIVGFRRTLGPADAVIHGRRYQVFSSSFWWRAGWLLPGLSFLNSRFKKRKIAQ